MSSELPNANPARGREEDLNPGPPDYKSGDLTNRPRRRLGKRNVCPNTLWKHQVAWIKECHTKLILGNFQKKVTKFDGAGTLCLCWHGGRHGLTLSTCDLPWCNSVAVTTMRPNIGMVEYSDHSQV